MLDGRLQLAAQQFKLARNSAAVALTAYIKKMKEEQLEGELIKKQVEEEIEREKLRDMERKKRAA